MKPRYALAAYAALFATLFALGAAYLLRTEPAPSAFERAIHQGVYEPGR